MSSLCSSLCTVNQVYVLVGQGPFPLPPWDWRPLWPLSWPVMPRPVGEWEHPSKPFTASQSPLRKCLLKSSSCQALGTLVDKVGEAPVLRETAFLVDDTGHNQVHWVFDRNGGSSSEWQNTENDMMIISLALWGRCQPPLLHMPWRDVGRSRHSGRCGCRASLSGGALGEKGCASISQFLKRQLRSWTEPQKKPRVWEG